MYVFTKFSVFLDRGCTHLYMLLSPAYLKNIVSLSLSLSLSASIKHFYYNVPNSDELQLSTQTLIIWVPARMWLVW
jgi:hypothetical protein